MKKITPKDHERLLRFLATQANRRARRKDRKKKGKKSSLIESVMVPSQINLDTNFEETVGFLIKVKEIFFKEHRRVFFNFSNLKDVSPAAGLLLVSEIYRIKQKSHSDKHRPPWVNGNYPEDDKIWFLLDELGFYNLLNIPRRKHNYEIPDVKFIQYISGNILIGERLADFLGQISLFKYFEHIDVATSKKPYESFTESIANVLHHA